MKKTSSSRIAVEICFAVLFLCSCSKSSDADGTGTISNPNADTRLTIITRDGTASGLPADFLVAFGPDAVKRALDSKPPAISSLPEPDGDSLLPDNANCVRCRVEWLSKPGTPELDEANTICCVSGAEIRPWSGVEMYSTLGSIYLMRVQDFFVPKTEQPLEFSSKRGRTRLNLGTDTNASDKEILRAPFLYDGSKVKYYQKAKALGN